ncbi:MAG: ABC transporter permease subunit [Acetatifactor sp.]|nr:ABC transporter permease subunit [Acetatifactor sp.]
MINMMKADFYRIFRGMGIYIGFAIMVLMIVLDIYTVSAGSLVLMVSTEAQPENELNNMSYDEVSQLSINEYRKYLLASKNYQLDRDILAQNINLYYVFIFVGAVIITADFSGGSVKNTLSSAISRRKYFLSKLACVVLSCVVLFFLNTYIMYFANIIFNGTNLALSIGTITRITLLQLPPVLALTSILIGFGFVLKRPAAFNTATISFMLVIQLLLSLLSFFFKIPESVYDFELSNMLARLAYNPSGDYITKSYLVCAAIIIIALLLGWSFFKKAEIK